MPRIYLSYAPADADFAGRLARALEQVGVQVAREVAPIERLPEDSQEAAERIEMTMRASGAVIVLLSPAALASSWVRQEFAAAQALERSTGTHVIFVVIAPVNNSGALGFAGADISALPNMIDAIERSPEETSGALLHMLPTDVTGAGEERARGITFPTSGPDEWAVGAAAEAEAPPERLSPGGPPQPPAPAPGAPPFLNESPASAPTTGALARMAGPASNVISSIEFSAYHANTLPVDTWNTLLIYTASGEAAHAVRADAATFTELGSAPRVARGPSGLIVARGAELTIEPHMEGVTFSPASDTFSWRGPWHRSLFRFQAAAALADTEQPGWVDIYAGAMVPIARIDLAFAFTASRPALAMHRPAGRTVTSNPHDTVFISYSHRDREAFSQACDEYARFGINVFTDEHLEAGADYERELGRMIASARVFHLLWSPVSASSAECRKEWMAALQREPSERFIKPWFWRQPLIPPPPEFAQHHISFRFQRLRRRLLRPETWF